MSDLSKRLVSTERVIRDARLHWACLWKKCGMMLAFMVLGSDIILLFGNVKPIRYVGALIFFGAIIRFAYQVYDWHDTSYIITDKRMFYSTGMLSREVAVMPLSKVTDLTYRQSLMGRILDYGDFSIESPGTHPVFVHLTFIAEPEKLYKDVSELLFGNPDAVMDLDDESEFGRYWSRRNTKPLPVIPRD